MRKIWDIHGGVHPPENKLQSVREPIGSISLPEQFILPLSQHVGAPAHPVVKVGDKVLKGQTIAEPAGAFSAALHAPSSGEVIAIEDRPVAHPSGLTGSCIVIRADGLDQGIALEPCEDVDALEPGVIVNRIREAGIAGLGGAGFPTAVKLSPKTAKIDTLILNGTECEPYITADDMLMREHAGDIVCGALLLARLVGSPPDILIGIEDNKPHAANALKQAAKGTRVEIVVFPTKYPSGGEKQLIQILTGKEVPSGQIPAQIGVLVQNVGTAYAAWRAIRYGEPLIERVTTVVGEALGRQRNIRARIGTPIDHILGEHGLREEAAARLIIGGPMMGFAVENLQVPLVKTTNCILVPSHQEMPEPPPAQPCIRCGMCAEACPAQLLPQQLFWYAQAEDFDRLQNHNLFDCIECGACSFVCPSAIPLVQYYRAAKGTIRKVAAEKQKSDRARARFEQRKERITKAELEKEAKRLARKKAAEDAKKQLTSESEAKPEAQEKPSLVREAMAQVDAQREDPAKKREALERALTSAEMRVARLQQQLREETDSVRAEKISASIKQAELKLLDAKDKLKAFDHAGNAEAAPSAAVQDMLTKMSLSPLQAQQKAVASLQQRLNAAEAKLAEAQQQGAANAAALEQGVHKLKGKLAEAEAALAELAATPASAEPSASTDKLNAAAAAIARAQAKAVDAAALSPIEKQQRQIASLSDRLSKARERLAKAEAEGSEQADALRISVEKLHDKLRAAEADLAELER